jgi:hypothetical protein
MRKANIKKSMAVIAKHVVKSASKPTTYNLGLTSLSDRVSINLLFIFYAINSRFFQLRSVQNIEN